MTRAIAIGSYVFIGGCINGYGSVVNGPMQFQGHPLPSWIVKTADGVLVRADDFLLIDCTQLKSLCAHQLAPGGHA